MNNRYYVYITTNPSKTTLYIGVTNDLYNRMYEHYQNRGDAKTFAGKYYCSNLIYYEEHFDPNRAIAREKELKGWRREKKMNLINSKNPTMGFLNKNL